mgnify:FL=1
MLKQLLQLLLNTRTTPEEAAHSAMPSDTYTRLVDNGTIGSEWTAQAFSGIAAYDGYLFFAGTSTSAVPIVGIATAGCASNLTFPWEGARLATTIPIAKGQTWTVQGSSLKDVIIDLSKTVSLGGGYNSFVWRALSCLRALSNYSPRSFCKANPNGLHPRAFQKGGCSCHLRLPNMSLLTMDTLVFTKTLQTQGNLLMYMPLTQLIQSLQGFAWALLKDLLHTQKLFLLEKAARSLSLMIQIQSKNYGFRRLSAAINKLGVGGALC